MKAKKSFKIEKMHKTTNIILKRANIDSKIIPIIEWINSLDACSCGCCQGDDDSNHCCTKSYVVFVCWDDESMHHIISVVNSYIHKYKNEFTNRPIELICERSLCDPFYISPRITLKMLNESVVTSFIGHIKGLKENNLIGDVSTDTLGDANIGADLERY